MASEAPQLERPGNQRASPLILTRLIFWLKPSCCGNTKAGWRHACTSWRNTISSWSRSSTAYDSYCTRLLKSFNSFEIFITKFQKLHVRRKAMYDICILLTSFCSSKCLNLYIQKHMVYYLALQVSYFFHFPPRKVVLFENYALHLFFHCISVTYWPKYSDLQSEILLQEQEWTAEELITSD